MIAPYQKMNNERLEQLLSDLVANLSGKIGQWEFLMEGVQLYCITDESYDRMRIVAPIAELKDIPRGEIQKCMEANFDRTLDARYCVYRDHLWSAFVHPLSELSDQFLESALAQVVRLHKNFGGSYSSGTLVINKGTQFVDQ